MKRSLISGKIAELIQSILNILELFAITYSAKTWFYFLQKKVILYNYLITISLPSHYHNITVTFLTNIFLFFA